MTKYISPSTQKEVRFPQYFAELLVARKAKKDGVVLPLRYWSNPEFIIWTKEYKSQVFGATKLLRIFDSDVIIKTFLQNDWVYSAHSPRFQQLIREESRKQANQPKEKPISIIQSTDKTPTKFGTQSKKSKLRD